MLLPDDEVVAQLDALVEAWEQLQNAERELRVFDSSRGQPRVPAHQFGDTEDFLLFNQRRREYWQEREDIRRRRDDADKRFKESAGVVQVLLPERCGLIHHHAGFRHHVENRDGQIVVLSAAGPGQQL